MSLPPNPYGRPFYGLPPARPSTRRVSGPTLGIPSGAGMTPHSDTPMLALLGVRQRCPSTRLDHPSAARNRGYAKVSPRRTPKSHLQLRFGFSGTGGCSICDRVSNPTLGMDSGSGAGMTGKRGHAHGGTLTLALPRLGVRQRRTCSIYDPSRERGPDHLSAARNRGYAKVSPRRTPESHLQLRFGLSGSSTGGFPICVRVDGPTLGMDSGSGAGIEKRRHAHGRSVFSGLPAATN